MITVYRKTIESLWFLYEKRSNMASEKSAIKLFDKLYRPVVISLLTGIALTIVIGGGKYFHDLEGRAFTSEDKRANIERFFEKVESDPNTSEWFEHIQNPDVHMNKSTKDSIYVSRSELQELIKNTALNYYEVMRSQTKHENDQSAINKMVEYKLDLILTKLNEK